MIKHRTTPARTRHLGNALLPLKLIDLPEQSPSPDFNEDGVVNAADLALLLGAWGPCIGPPSACCDADGFGGCLVLDEVACAQAGGTYLPGSPCSACPPAACGAGSGDCCSDNGTPGCDVVDCCSLVCASNSSCCDTAWDAQCALDAMALCVPTCTPPPFNDDCLDRVAIGDGTFSFDTTGATTDGSAHPTCQLDGQTYHDVWYNYTATCDGFLEVSTCDLADYDSDLVVYDGCDCGALTLLGCNDDAFGCEDFSSRVVVSAEMGNCYKIRVGGSFDGDFGAGDLSVTCLGTSQTGTPPPGFACPPDLNCDGEVNAADLAILLGSWGPV